MDTPDTKLVIRDLPIIGWILGIGFIIVAAINLPPSYAASGMAGLVLWGILAGIGLLLLLLFSALTVTADRVEQTLTLRYRSLLAGSMREMLFSEIEAIEMEMTQQRSSRSNSGPSYRIVVRLKDGEVVPFRKYYTGGSRDKTNKIRQLRDFIGVGGSEMGMGLMGTLREVTKKAQQEFQQQQEALTGRQAEVHETDGVHWQVQTVAFGGQPVTRWFSPDYRTGNSFVYVTQVVEGQKMSSGGLLGGLGSMLFKPAMAIYGFGQEDTPQIEQATVFDLSDPRMTAFSVYTSAPAVAQQVLNPQITAALADWARRYPLKTIQSNRAFQQLIVMFSPKGVYVASLGTLVPEAVEEMTRLGVELVKTQSSQPDAPRPLTL